MATLQGICIIPIKTHLSHKTSFVNIWRYGLFQMTDSNKDVNDDQHI